MSVSLPVLSSGPPLEILEPLNSGYASADWVKNPPKTWTGLMHYGASCNLSLKPKRKCSYGLKGKDYIIQDANFKSSQFTYPKKSHVNGKKC